MHITKVALKEPLGLIIRNRRGYQKELKPYSEYIDKFMNVGFINTGHTLKAETYSTTKLADEYYKDIYGNLSYYMQRLYGLLKHKK